MAFGGAAGPEIWHIMADLSEIGSTIEWIEIAYKRYLRSKLRCVTPLIFSVEVTSLGITPEMLPIVALNFLDRGQRIRLLQKLHNDLGLLFSFLPSEIFVQLAGYLQIRPASVTLAFSALETLPGFFAKRSKLEFRYGSHNVEVILSSLLGPAGIPDTEDIVTAVLSSRSVQDELNKIQLSEVNSKRALTSQSRKRYTCAGYQRVNQYKPTRYPQPRSIKHQFHR